MRFETGRAVEAVFLSAVATTEATAYMAMDVVLTGSTALAAGVAMAASVLAAF